MNRIADPAVPGADKTALIESATPGDAAAMDKFGQALRQNGYTPLEVRGRGICGGSEGEPDDGVGRDRHLKSANEQAGDFSSRWSSSSPTTAGS